MAIAKDKMISTTQSSVESSLDVVLCGQGRIGRHLSQKLNKNNISHQFARLEPQLGLKINSSLQINFGLKINSDLQVKPSLKIKTLVIVISNRERSNVKPTWYWHKIFSGFMQQLNNQEIEVKNILMVSSTRVYDGNENGLIDAGTPAKPKSLQGKQLLFAENQLLQSSSNARILRASGLYGDEYSKYHPTMTTSIDKCRFGIDMYKVVSRLYHWIIQAQNDSFVQGIELLTDGKVYYQGNQYDMAEDQHKVAELSNQHRVLSASSCSKNNLSNI